MIKAWIHKETGLPCFYLDGPDAGAAVYDGDRLINPTGTVGQASVAFCDPFAPPGVATTYTVGARRFTLTRRGEGYAVTSLDSRQRAVVSYIGDDAREYDTRATATDINARRTPVVRWAGVAAYTGKLELLAYSEESDRLERILEAREPVIAVHSHDACDLPDCDIPAVRVLAVTHATSQRTGRRDRVRRQWTLDYRQIDLDEARTLVGNIPVVTWGAWDARSKWHGRSYADILREFAGMP